MSARNANVEPYVTVRAIRPLVSGLRALGFDPSPLLAAVGITETQLEHPDLRVPMSVALRCCMGAGRPHCDRR